LVGKRAAQDFRMGAEPQKGERGHTTKGDCRGGLILSVCDRSLMVWVVLIHQGKPDVDVGKIRHAGHA
jgi:hypothetical protein